MVKDTLNVVSADSVIASPSSSSVQDTAMAPSMTNATNKRDEDPNKTRIQSSGDGGDGGVVVDQTMENARHNDDIVAPVPVYHAAGAVVPTTYVTTKQLILKCLGVIYWVAFLGAWYQNDGLMGRHGLVPVHPYLDRIGTDRYGHPKLAWDGFLEHPSLHWLWWAPSHDPSLLQKQQQQDRWDRHDANMRSVVLCGLTCSGWLILGGLKLPFGRSSATTTKTVVSIPEAESMLQLAFLWILYFTIVTTSGGTSFYSYGWESQLLETGFLSIFLCQDVFPRLPYLSSSSSSSSPSRPLSSPPPCSSTIVLWLFRWLCFRISLGAGLIKIRGDSCWTQKTCLLYHFETQPIPSPMSFIFHFLPSWMLRRAVDLDLLVQVYTSWMVLVPTSVQWLVRKETTVTRTVNRMLLNVVRIGGFIQIGFMINILLSGNFAFLNHLTIIPALACLDDACWPYFFFLLPSSTESTTHGLDGQSRPHEKDQQQVVSQDQWWGRWWKRPRMWLDVVLFVVIMYLSRPVIENLLQLDGRRQQMNASFDPFRLVGTYGAFGSVGKQRYEPIISFAYDDPSDGAMLGRGVNRTIFLQSEDELEWIELEFPCKPGSVDRRPCFCAPYHYRLDWNIWFIGFKPHAAYLNRRETWLYELLNKILIHEERGPDAGTKQQLPRPWLRLLDPATAGWLQTNYEEHGLAPKYAKVDMYHYKMDAPLWKIGTDYFNWLMGRCGQLKDGKVTWWRRSFEENLVPIVSLNPDDQRLIRATIP